LGRQGKNPERKGTEMEVVGKGKGRRIEEKGLLEKTREEGIRMEGRREREEGEETR
jgi:hypothetical protein